MKVLIACEYSGIVRAAFKARGHDAWSCDIIPTERPGQHIVNDVRNVLDAGWDLMIAHPPCTYLSNAGVRWLKPYSERWQQMLYAVDFFNQIMQSDIPMIAVENPVMHGHAKSRIERRCDQIVNPSDFGDGVTKKTCLWLHNLPPLMATLVISDPFINWTEYGQRSAKARSKTFPGFATAMANQWGG